MAPSDDNENPPAPPPPNPPMDALSAELASAIADGVGRVVSSSMDKLSNHFDASLSLFASNLNNSLNSLKGTPAQTQATGTTSQAPAPTPPVAPQVPVVPPTTVPLPFPYAPPGAPGANPFVPPSTLNPAAGASSILRFFPEVEASVLQSVVKHELRPQHLHKLITTTAVKPIASTALIYTADGFQVQEPSVTRELPTFNIFLKALTLYFDVLSTNIFLTTGDIATYAHVARGGYIYLRSLNHYLTMYTYRTVLEFHMVFHAKRLREMEDGDYSGWSRTDGELVMQILQPSAAAAQLSNERSSTSSPKPKQRSNSPKVEQVCNNFNDNRCSTPCRNGRLHKCYTCGSDAHGRSSCTTKSA
ncbi:hypothetical protein AB1N83_005173 [Pleurotus pulmonarius]